MSLEQTSALVSEAKAKHLAAVFDGLDLDFGSAHALFDMLMKGQLSSIEISALLIALKVKGEHSNEIAGAAKAMYENAARFPRPEYDFSDIVGTGGDGHNTINISSAAAVVAASCGIRVAKHGNRSVSSKSGSSDLFAAFGLKLDMSAETARSCLDQTNLCFLAAPHYHSGMKYVMPVRTELKTRTLFNILGPLANPARPTHGIFGVYTPELLDVYANILLTLGHQNAYVVHGSGLDELALHGVSHIKHVSQGKICSLEVGPKDFGLHEYALAQIEGDIPETNKEYIEAVFIGKGKPAHTAAIAMNAAALLQLNNKADNFKQATDIAMASIEQGLPMKTMEQAAFVSHQ